MIERLVEHFYSREVFNPDPNQMRNLPNWSGLKKLLHLLKTISLCTRMRQNRVNSSFKVYIEEKLICQNLNGVRNDQNQNPERTDQNRNVNVKILHYWCFNPKFRWIHFGRWNHAFLVIKAKLLLNFRMKDLVDQRIRCLIMTSSTLTPFLPMLSELRIPMPIQHVNGHVVRRFQVCAKIVSEGVGSVTMDSTLDNR